MRAQNPYIHQYTTLDGLPSNVVYQVYQDSRKFIWFATDAGVARFDGSIFTYFRKQDGLSCNDVVRIKEDSQERIWFFNMNATLNYFFQNEIYNETNAPFLDSLKTKEFFRDFFEDEDKTLYFYYNHQREIFTLDSNNVIKKYTLPSLLVDGGITSEHEGMVIRYLKRDTTGKFYLWTTAGLFKLHALDEKPILVSDVFCFRNIYPNTDNSYFAVGAKQNKSSGYTIVEFKDGIMHERLAQAVPIGCEFISAIVEDVDGFLWVSTFDKGVFCYKDKIIRHFDIEEALAIAQDHEENIWISSLNEGVFKISPYINKHAHYEKSSFQNRSITALNHHISQGLWCTNGKTVYFLQSGELFTSDFQKEEGSFNRIVQVNKNTISLAEVGTPPLALDGIRLDHKLKKIFFKNSSISPKPLKEIVINPMRTEITGFNSYNLELMDSVALFGDIKVVWLNERIYNIFYNSRNELVVNAKKNYIYHNDSFTLCEELSCFDNENITDHLNLNEDTELFNIEGDSLFLLNNKRLINLSASFKYPIDLQIKYMDFNEPTLFIATTRNIYTCDNPIDIIANKPVHLQPLDLSFKNIHDILFNDNSLYIASDDGLTVIPYSAIYGIKTNSPIPYFQSIQINDEVDKVDRQDIVLSGRNRIHIEFSSINYSFSPVIFSYKLEGADNEWTVGIGTNVVYQNLPRGEYAFKLRVRKPTSDWSEPIKCGITIKATIWQHPLFYTGLSVLIAAMITMILIYRKNLQIKKIEREHQLVTLEQKALQSMMNPHFLFNALGSIQHYLLQNKPREAGLYLSQFARLVRQNIHGVNSPMLSLEAETDRLKNYLDLEKMRMKDRFDYKFEIDEDITDDAVMIPSMIIQPFVENSILHGISPLEKGGMIIISFSMVTDKAIRIVIEDNGVGIKQSKAFKSDSPNHLNLSMEMTRKRIEILGKKYKVATSLEVTEASPASPNPGTRVTVVLPVSYGDDQ
jgi:hypothetical protein